MSKPSSDRIDVDTCPQQVCCSGMPDHMRAHRFVAQRRCGEASLLRMAFNKGMDTEPSDRLTATVDEYALFRFTTPGRKAELLNRDRPKWAGSLLVAFAEQPDTTTMPVDIAIPEVCRFARPRAGVV